MSFIYELNHTLTELQLIFKIEDLDGCFLPFHKISFGDELPIIFDNKIRVAKWNHILTQDKIFINKLDDNLFKKDYCRCIVPIDGFLYKDQLGHTTHYYEEKKLLFFAAAICDSNLNFDFVYTNIDNQFLPILPIFVMLYDVDNWLGPLWESARENSKVVILDFMEVFDKLDADHSSPVCFQYLFTDIEESRKILHHKLKKITPKINQIL